MQQGRNAGITADIDLPRLGAKFEGNALGFDFNEDVGAESDAGRGDGQFPPPIPLSTEGGLVVTIQMRRDAWPSPPQFRGEAISVTLYMDKRESDDATPSVKCVVPCIVLGQKITYNEPKKTIWVETLTCRITGAPLWSGFGYDDTGVLTAQPTNAAQSYPTKVRWAGTQKTFDPNGLLTSASTRIRLFGIADNDSSEAIALADTIAAASIPMTGLKRRPGTIVRQSAQVCIVDVTWGLTDTKDDEEMPRSPKGITATGEFNTATITKVQDTASISVPPAPVGQHIATDIVQRNDGKWIVSYHFGSMTDAQKLTLPGAAFETDSSQFSDGDTIIVETSNATIPDTPTPRIADLQLIRITSVRVGGTPVVWTHTFRFGRNTAKNTAENEGTNTDTDPDSIGESATITLITATATNSAPAAPTGVLLESTSKPLITPTGAFAGWWQHVYKYGPTTRLQSITFEGNQTVDPSTINDSEVVTLVSNSSASPGTPTPNNADLKFNHRVSTRFQGTPEKWKHQFYFERNTAEDDLELGGSNTNTDPDNFGESARIAVLNGSATPPSAPAAPTGQLVGTDIQPLKIANSGFTGLWRITFIYGPTTQKQQIEQEGELVDDQSDLEDEDTQTLTSTSVTPPATPSARISGQVLILIRSRKIQNTPEKWRHTFQFGWNTNQTQRERAGSIVVVDPVDIYHRETTAITTFTGTISELETTIRDANRTNKYFDKGTGQIINPTRALTKKDESGDDRRFAYYGGNVFLDSLKGRPTGGLASVNPAVYGNTAALIHINVQGIIVGGTGGFFGGRVMPVYTYRRRGKAVFRRRFSLNTPTSMLFPELEGKTNNAAFCGRPPHSLMFAGAKFEFAFDDVGYRPVIVDYIFDTDSELFINDGDLPDSGSRVSTGGFPLLSGSGFFAATLFDAFALLSWPSDTNFNVFTA